MSNFSSIVLSLSCFVAFLVATTVSQPATEKVVLALYAESLCPDCISYTQGPLSEAFEKVPYSSCSSSCNILVENCVLDI